MNRYVYAAKVVKILNSSTIILHIDLGFKMNLKDVKVILKDKEYVSPATDEGQVKKKILSDSLLFKNILVKVTIPNNSVVVEVLEILPQKKSYDNI